MLALTALLLVASTPDAGITRLDLARTWEAAQLFHPSVIHREVDLDGAFVAAVKALDGAKTDDERRAAVGLVLAPLKDPSSRVFRPTVADQEKLLSTRPGVTVVHAASAELTPAFVEAGALEKALGEATRVVVDLRGVPEDSPVFGLPLNPPRDVTLAPVQSLAHLGYDANPGGLYRARLEVTPGSSFTAEPAAVRRKWAVVLGSGDSIPDWALALREAGLAVFVSNEPVGDEGALAFTAVKLGDGWNARVRSSEYVGGHRLETDVLVPKGQDVLVAASKALSSGAKPKPATNRNLEPVRLFALGADSKAFPDREHRLLAGLRLWLVSKRFWAYPYLRKVDLDGELLALFTALENATTPRLYGDALRAAAVKLLPDSHTFISSPEQREQHTWPPFDITLVEDKPVLSAVTPHAAPLQKWDELIEVGGVKMNEAIARQLPLTPGSRDDGRRLIAMQYVLSRTNGDKVKVTVDRAGQRITADLTWRDEDAATLFETPVPGPHFKVLEGNLGYIDVVNLEPQEVDAAMAAVEKTRALVLDVRGYPKGTGFDIGPRLGPDKSIPGVAAMCTPVVRPGPAESDRTCEFFVQQLPEWGGVRYTAPMVALINLDAISHAEHTALIFEAYGHPTFVGSPTRGANGNISHMRFPGDVRMSFTGLEVKHADGRQSQTIGIVPDVLVRPTLAGLRAGKDEVLEKALGVLKQKAK